MASKRRRESVSARKAKLRARGASSEGSNSKPVSKVQPLTPKAGVELFFGLVSPTGANVDLVIEALRKHLKSVGYRTQEIRISELIDSVTGRKASSLPVDERIDILMDEGTRLRQEYVPDICARLAIAAVRQVRQVENRRSHKEHPESIALGKTAYIFRSLKTREEVDTLRIVYGKAFNLLSIYSNEESRKDSLAKRIAKSRNDTNHHRYRATAERLIYKDAEEPQDHGQDVRNTFPMADAFLSLDSADPSSLDYSVKRFVRLMFDDPFVTPTRDEYGMFMARAVALRSADLGRQVGAAILSDDGDLIAAGCNEVPKFGGGQYWEGDEPDMRDFRIGTDASVEQRTGAIAELLSRFGDAGWLSESARKSKPGKLALEMLDGEQKEHFVGSQILAILEYGRSVHAEMAAITDAAKRGVSIDGCSLFSTTFPCHLCARHVISSGLKRVVYIEPYAKSKAQELYDDSIAVNPAAKVTSKVVFEPFVGVSPGRYLEFFQPNSDRKDRKGRALVWEGQDVKTSRLKRYIYSYMLMEEAVLKDVGELS